MKRLIPAAAVLLSVLTGCAAKLPEGCRQFTEARDAYERLDSAMVTMTDLDTGERVMEFSFYFTQKDEMVLSYYGCWDGEVQQAYSDGAEFFYKESGDEKWSVIDSDDENYIYNIYNRKYRYPYAEGRMFFLAAEAVEEAQVSHEGGGTRITYIYDPEKLNQASMPGVEESIQDFSALTTVMKIGADGIVDSFTEMGTVTSVSGETVTLNMEITIDKANEDIDIPYPVDEVYGKGEKPVQTSQASDS